MSRRREVKQFIEQLEGRGWSLLKKGSNHIKMGYRCGDKKKFIFFASSPSDYRWKKNVLSVARRIESELQIKG